MVKAGEAHVAHLLPPDLVSDLKTVVEPTTESVGFRINTEHPVLKDQRVRQAIVYSIDTQAMLDTMLKGFTVPANGQMVRKSSFGYNSNLKPYPYRLDEAKKLVQEAGAVGAQLEFWNRVGYFPKSEEVAEVIVSSINQTGLNVSLKNVEIAAGRESLYKVKPGDTRNDFLMTAASNPVFDSSRVMDSYYPCEGRFSMWCDQEFTQKWKAALGLIGEERDKAFQELWSIAYDRVAFAPLFGLDYVHGIDPRLKWTPRDDGFMLFSEMELSS
jgi:peptide/nickel transport system substrate-binding protein